MDFVQEVKMELIHERSELTSTLTPMSEAN